MRVMKNPSIFIVVVSVALLSNAALATTYEATGKWSYSITGHRNNCQTPPILNEAGTVVLVQTANTSLLIFESAIANNFKTINGTINGAVYEYTDKYQEDNG